MVAEALAEEKDRKRIAFNAIRVSGTRKGLFFIKPILAPALKLGQFLRYVESWDPLATANGSVRCPRRVSLPLDLLTVLSGGVWVLLGPLPVEDRSQKTLPQLPEYRRMPE